MTTVMKAMRLLAFGAVGLAFSLSSCKGATSKDDLPLEEWVVTSAYVKYADSSHAMYDTAVTFTFADPSSAAGSGYTDDYSGKKATDPATLYMISSGTITGSGWGAFVLSAPPDPATHPVVTFDTNHYFYRRGSGYSSTVALAKCHIKTSSIAVIFEQ